MSSAQTFVGAAAFTCPVCRAKFRGEAVCSRCGTELGGLMEVAAKAWRIREQSRAALLAGDLLRSLCLSACARRLHRVV
jgi:predicted amidophosphoribosyltransferase